MTTKARRLLRRARKQVDDGLRLIDEALAQQARRDAIIAAHRTRQSAQIIPFPRREAQ